MPYIGRDLNRGNYLKLDDISSSFNSSTKTFNLTVGGSAFKPGSAFSILVSVGGVIQEPEAAYQVNNSEITFANAPTAQDSFFLYCFSSSNWNWCAWQFNGKWHPDGKTIQLRWFFLFK